MNAIEIEQENYFKVILQLRNEIKKCKGPDSQIIKSNNSSLSLYNIKNQQLQEDQQISDIQREGQIDSNITNLQRMPYIEMLEQAEKYLKLVYETAYNISHDDLEKKFQAKETIPYKLIKQISYPQICQSLSFNFDNTLLATTQGSNIKIFNFNYNKGNIEQIANFEAHESNINSLVFSKKSNYLFSGGDDFFIHIWEELKSKNQWKNKISINTKWPISCMILNSKENLIIVGNKYGFIQTWNLNVEQETITIILEIRKVHQQNIFGISLNLFEDRLITCSQDKKIILWSIDQRGLMQKITEQERINFVSSIIFLYDNTILLTQNKKGLIELKLDDDTFKQDEKIILEDPSEDCPNFPIQFNKTKNIIIIKHNQFVYMYRELNKGSYDLQNKIVFDSIKVYGAFSSKGKYLVTLNEQLLRLYELVE
ncbi:unnamed protein product [Paramecium primaurelia]|uniref:WD40-repeat-containing domain n=1 Tax=Paramecium primaurelia TaxID=5886 RepID=A0A8S1PA96_PARPR|nr:unnamed protein product [Paramecium primaurelia]